MTPDASGDSNGTSAFQRALIVANPISGRGRGAKAAAELAEGLTRNGIETRIHMTRAAGDATEHLASLEDPVDLVVSVGGDGTLREVLSGLKDPTTAVGMLPFGTANVLAKELGLSRKVDRALEILLGGNVMPVDVTRVNGRLSLLMTGIGIDAIAVREVDRRRTGPISLLTYVGAVLRILWSYRAPKLRVELDGDDYGREVGFVLVSNTVNYAGYLTLSPDARMDDGELEVYLFPTGSILQVALAFLRGVVAHLPGGPVTMRRARRVRVTSAEPVPFQIDGDPGGETPVEIELEPSRHRLVVPRGT